jgi:DNA-binding NtrC family response regulator
MKPMSDHKPTILVVDDETVILRMVLAIIDDLGFAETYTATDAETALELYEERRPSVVLTDVKLPGMDGVELARLIKAEDPHSSVLLMSAHGEPDSHPGDGFLPKPFDVDQLNSLVEPYAHAYSTNGRSTNGAEARKRH